MSDDLIERLESAANLGLDLCQEAADALRELEEASAVPDGPPDLNIAEASLEVQVEAERFIDRIALSLRLQRVMARCGMDAELVAIKSSANSGLTAVVNLHGVGFGASALFHVSHMLQDAKSILA